MANKPTQQKEKMCCGLVMPISTIDGCNEQHWLDVKDILTDAIEAAGFESKLVVLKVTEGLNNDQFFKIVKKQSLRHL